MKLKLCTKSKLTIYTFRIVFLTQSQNKRQAVCSNFHPELTRLKEYMYTQDQGAPSQEQIPFAILQDLIMVRGCCLCQNQILKWLTILVPWIPSLHYRTILPLMRTVPLVSDRMWQHTQT